MLPIDPRREDMPDLNEAARMAREALGVELEERNLDQLQDMLMELQMEFYFGGNNDRNIREPE